MSLLQPYVGKKMSAPSATKKIDIETILQGCAEVDNIADEVAKLNLRFKEKAKEIDEDALSCDEKSPKESIELCADRIDLLQKKILDATDAIRDVVESVYNKIQWQLNEETVQKEKDI